MYIIETSKRTTFVVAFDSLFDLVFLLNSNARDFKVYEGGCEMSSEVFGWGTSKYWKHWKYGVTMIRSKD